jgi:hypothetical protein
MNELESRTQQLIEAVSEFSKDAEKEEDLQKLHKEMDILVTEAHVLAQDLLLPRALFARLQNLQELLHTLQGYM